MTLRGSGYTGTDGIKTSKANEEIVPSKPEGWSVYQFYKFQFINHNKTCKVKINGGSPIYLHNGYGFETTSEDSPIRSFIIVDSGVEYSFTAAY